MNDELPIKVGQKLDALLLLKTPLVLHWHLAPDLLPDLGTERTVGRQASSNVSLVHMI